MEKIILVGGGGHCKSVIDVIRSSNQFEILGVLDHNLPKESLVLDVSVLGDDSAILSLKNECLNVHITIGQIKSSVNRHRIVDFLMQQNLKFPNVISSSAMVSSYSKLGQGITVMHQAIVQADASIGDFTIINNKALIEHDVRIGNFCHISTGALINGNVTIGNDVFIGSGAVIVQGFTIPDGSFIKANQLVR